MVCVGYGKGIFLGSEDIIVAIDLTQDFGITVVCNGQHMEVVVVLIATDNAKITHVGAANQTPHPLL
jgi:hypothetical protein